MLMKLLFKCLILSIAGLLTACSTSKETNAGPERALVVTAEHSSTEDGFTFSLIAERKRKSEKEYFPSSETIRLTITDADGQMRYMSSIGMNYLAVITDVLPEEVGDKHEYVIEWDGKSNTGTSLASGKYTAILTLPTHPQAYTRTIEFEI